MPCLVSYKDAGAIFTQQLLGIQRSFRINKQTPLRKETDNIQISLQVKNSVIFQSLTLWHAQEKAKDSPLVFGKGFCLQDKYSTQRRSGLATCTEGKLANFLRGPLRKGLEGLPLTPQPRRSIGSLPQEGWQDRGRHRCRHALPEVVRASSACSRL